ncbi:PREDICTED: ankyrin repeat and LEM domain-containing protein 1 [Haliaeetus leucocephalus]|uniref:ankyrin repeat and LEM domain-containing protein 1 n=1 Tax=Haliaeetus leucocephalus TaxID=52644 RepID=UPI00053CDD58|nr:PREDICTED: ankyrin repeat and LEM domain-containing protein 1 [Haliaeetus leucocephalus]
MPLHVAASWGCCRCLEVPLKKGGVPELRDQDGKRAIDLALGQGNRACVQILRDLQYARGWAPTEDLGGPGCSLSFLTEDGTEDSVFSQLPEDGSETGPLSSTRRSQLEELELGGGCGLGEPPLWLDCPPEPPSLSIPSFTPWPQVDPRGSALPPQPLASSTLLSAGDELGEGPQSQTMGGRMGGPPQALLKPSTGDSPCPQQDFGPSGSLNSPQPQSCSRVLGAHRASPVAPVFRGGLSSCSVACQSPGMWHGDIPGAAAQHRRSVPRGRALGRHWAGLPPDLGTAVLEAGAGDWDRSSLGDSSSASERFVTAVETMEPTEARGCPGVWHRRSPQPRAAAGSELGEAPSPTGAATWELPPASPPNAERVQSEDFWGTSRAAPCCKDGSDVGDVGELLAQLQGCSLQGSPPCTPGPLPSPASLTTGDVTPWDQEPHSHRHVTPRTKSRLRASAARLSASSSSSLFDETLEMPQRPPRLRAPRGVPKDPVTTSGRCITLGDEDVSSRDGEGTGSLDDTEILPGAPSQPSSPPGASSSPSSSPTVLLVPGDHGCPQDSPSDAQGSPGSSPTVLLVPGDHGHPQESPSDAQGSPGSSPTVLLVPGDHGHPQESPSDSQGSPSSSPTVLVVAGDHGHPQDSPSDAWDSPHAAGSPNPRVLEDGSGWQDTLPLGTCQPPRPHGTFSRLPAPRLPGSTVVELGTPAVPLSPTGCGAHRTTDHLEDEERGRVPTKQHSPSTEAIASPEDPTAQDGRACTAPPRPLSDEALRRRLRALGDDPGPVTELTRWLYLRRLEEPDAGTAAPGHSPELAAALRTGCVPDCTQDELALVRQFDRPDRSRHWREGLVKSSFNYLLLDPRTTQNLPLRSHRLSPAECFRTFIEAIFYVGKGTRARPYCHLAEALSQHRGGTRKGCPKVRRILEIWASGQGVISVHCFQNTVPAEAYTREGCLVEALGLQTITNQRKGNCYGVAASWPADQRRRLGVHMLHRAMRIFLAEGERQLRPADIQGGR